MSPAGALQMIDALQPAAARAGSTHEPPMHMPVTPQPDGHCADESDAADPFSAVKHTCFSPSAASMGSSASAVDG